MRRDSQRDALDSSARTESCAHLFFNECFGHSSVREFHRDVLRLRQPDLPRPYRTWGYPVTPLVYMAITAWMVTYIFLQRPLVSLAGLGTLLLGLLVYFPASRKGLANAA